MRHLSDVTLARLVEGEPTEAEGQHLRTCERCAGVLREFREQTQALGSLPALRPPAGDWEALEARLLRAGLIGAEAPAEEGAGGTAGHGECLSGERTAHGRVARGRPRRGGPRRPIWLQAAAALVLFLSGGAFGAWMGPSVESGGRIADGSTEGPPSVQGSGTVASVDEAAVELRAAEKRYVGALTTYREMLRESRAEDGEDPANPAARYAALEALVAASQEAIRQAPADPFFNGVLASTMAERQATIQEISTSTDDSWF